MGLYVTLTLNLDVGWQCLQVDAVSERRQAPDLT